MPLPAFSGLVANLRYKSLGTVDILKILYGAPLKSSFSRKRESRSDIVHAPQGE